jgi:hypothetical protein
MEEPLRPSWPTLLGRIHAGVEKGELVEIPLEENRPMEDQEREQAATPFPFIPFRSVAKFEVRAIIRVLDDRSSSRTAAQQLSTTAWRRSDLGPMA